MNIHIFALEPGPVSKAFLQVFNLTEDKLVEVDDKEKADVILLTDAQSLRKVYNEHQMFCVLVMGRDSISENQPENVCLVKGDSVFGENGFVKLVQMIERQKAKKPAVQKSAPPLFPDIARFTRRYSVLVIDDTAENLQTAQAVLKDHDVVTVSQLETAVGIMSGKHFDAVLTDMEMPPDKLYRALNLDSYGVAEVVSYGFAAMLEATERGIPVAIVTDGNHHRGWVSAMFDTKKGATVNGQKVLFFNDIGKRWDKALKSLLE